MKIIKPIKLTVSSSNQVIDDVDSSGAQLDNWASVTTYSKGDEVIRGTSIFVSTIDSNLGYNPDSEHQELEGARWLFKSATNKTKCIDGILANRTRFKDRVDASDNYTRRIDFTADDRFNAVAILGIKTASYYIYSQAKDGDSWASRGYIISGARPVRSWVEWMQSEFVAERHNYTMRFNGAQGDKFRISFHGAENMSLAEVVAGNEFSVGETLFGSQTRVVKRTLSTIETDAFGVSKAVKRGMAQDVTYRVKIPREGFAFIEAAIDDVDGIPVVTHADEVDSTSLINYGYIKGYEIRYEHPDFFIATITSEGIL